MSPLAGAAQDAKTQQIQLDEGWNLVSLNVHPGDSSFASIFGEAAGQISMVKAEDGDVYVPSEGIEQISTWRDGKGYRIQAEEATTLDVTGSKILPEARPIVLEPGGNVVPYLSSTAQPVETALVSVEESLLAVEDESGSRYNPSGGASSLDSLRPGQGYKVYVEQADTLVYPRVAGTLEDALALQGMANGDYVQIRGYHEPGDRGGGLFRVRANACRTDGGTCFVFEKDLSAEKSVNTTQSEIASGVSLPDDDLAWRSVELQYGTDPEHVAPSLELHGRYGRHQNEDALQTGKGRIGGPALQLLNKQLGGDTDELTVRYRHATSERRLERTGVDDAVSLEWWGAPKADPANPKDVSHYISWAMTVARNLRNNNNLEWGYVDVAGEYYWDDTIVMPDGVMLRGVGPIRDDGFTRAAFIVTPGEAMDHYRKSYDAQEENDRSLPYQNQNARFTNEYLAGKGGLKAIELNGNLAGNMQVFNNLSDYDEPENRLQNGGAWAGWYSNGNGRNSFTEPYDIHLEDVSAHGFGGNIFAGAGGEIRAHTSGEVRVRNSRRNHIWYGWSGDLSNWTAEGYAWGVHMKTGGPGSTTISNFTLQNVEKNPQFTGGNNLISFIGSDVTIDGFTVDLTKEALGKPHNLFLDWSGNNTIKNGTVRTFTLDDNNGRLHFLRQPNLGIGPRVYENIQIYDEGGGLIFTPAEEGQATDITIKDVTVQAAQDVSGPIGESGGGSRFAGILGAELRSPISNRERPLRIDVENLSYERPFKPTIFPVKGASSGPYHPRSWYISNSFFENAQEDLIRKNSDALGNEAGKRAFRVFFENTTLNTYSAASWHKWMGNGIVRLRNCQDNSGRTSDVVSQSYTATSEDENNGYVLIPTSLMSRPGQTSVSTSAGYSVTNVEIANSDGTLRADDDTDQEDPYLRVSVSGSITQRDTFTWTARVTPLDEYTTTGLFVGRQVPERNYAGGGGPWKIDLRGVVESQEDDSAVTYTVSSENTSVVTTNVNSDGYTLELTEQGTGTATITVTGEIPGIGTATDTFEVTVE
ncbi:hypothetical protein [Salinibacter sp.]|uniref:hypothetical protein n=1 Tax=Salinibacter sp. TaxID=2065818 RepID=UPI0021E99A4A|nr:hypothetical protein [Salinibacter sp.]